MNLTLVEIGKIGLDQLRDELKADLLSCYFWNRYSGMYWLFHRSGKFRHPEQMTGPLTHAEQLGRMGGEGSRVFAPFHFSPRAENEMSRDILNGQSFVHREKIEHSFRFRFRSPNGSVVVIFLNYRGECQSDQTVESYVQQRHTLRDTLFHLIEEPYLDEKDAWRLRSMSLSKQKAFSDMLTSFETWGAADNSLLKMPHLAVKEYWDLIVGQAKTLLHPNDSNCLVCQLYTVDRDGGLTLLAGLDEFRNERDRGVCHYVARTAQMFAIEDVPDYQSKLESRGGPDDSKLPAFVPCVANAMSEIACPLVIQGKVVGVLNLESNQKGRYGDKEALLLYLYATSVALSLRQVVLFVDLKVAAGLQHELLSLNKEDSIMETVVKAVNALGYVAGIWAFDDSVSMKGSWVQGSYNAADSVRLEGGHTFWIRHRAQPIAIADYKPKEHYDARKKRIGDLDSARLFKRWRSADHEADFLAIVPSEKIAQIMYDHQIATDFGFPIFSESTGEQVRAVLWAKCFRHFVSVLDEEVWFLSLICRSASEACRVARQRMLSMKPIKVMEQKLFEYHFGEDRTRALLSSGTSQQDLSFKRADDIIVLQIDIRGSSKFADECFGCEMGNVFHEIMAEYHSMAQDKIQSQGGVYDKSVGDAVIGIFHAYRKDLLPFGDAIRKEESMLGALEAARLICDGFEGLMKRREDDAGKPLPFRLCMALGCIIEVGKGYLGSTSKAVPGLDFTVYGVVANRAGKLADLARWENLSAALQRDEITKLEGESFVPLTRNEWSSLAGLIEAEMKRRSPVQLLHVAYTVIKHELLKKYRTYKVTIGNYAVLWVCENRLAV